MPLKGLVRSLKQLIINESNCNFTEGRITPLHGSILIYELLDFFEKYDKVKDFLEVIKPLDVINKDINYGGASLRNGMYLRSFCDFLIEIEKLYVINLGQLERDLLVEGSVPELSIVDPSVEFSSSVLFVSKLNTIYSKMHQIINLVLENDLNGCQILNMCLKFKYSLPEEIFCLLVNYLNRPLIKQITSWILFGKLEDPCEEFFIKHVDSVTPGFSGTLETETHLSTAGSSGYQSSTSEMAEEIYEIDPLYLPLHVSFSLGNKILNVGKLVSLLRHAPSETDALPKFQNGDVGINEVEIIKVMKNLEQNDNFHLSNLENVVNFVWISVNKQLKKLAEEVGSLFSQHKMLMDFYLMQRGELMNDFIKRSLQILKADAKKTSNHSLNLSFRNTINNSGSNISWYLDHLRFYLPSKNIIPQGASCVTVLEMQYKKPWPLHFIFSTDVMDKYNTIFRFLLELKIAHLSLLNTWKEITFPQELSTYILYLKTKLQLFFTNLENYIFVDIIQSENEVWEAAVKKAETFNDIKVLHMNFLSNILLNLFLIQSKEVYNKLEMKRNSVAGRELEEMIVQKKIREIIAVSNQFCDLFQSKKGYSDMNQQLRRINSSFKNLIKSIIKIVQTTYKENDIPRLLLMRLNYNHFYSCL